MKHDRHHSEETGHDKPRGVREGRSRLLAVMLSSGLCAAAPILAASGGGLRDAPTTGTGDLLAAKLPPGKITEGTSTPDPAMDPFIAGALGIIPFSSGLYVSDRPARGLLFTAVDVLMVMGIYTSRYTASGDPKNTRNYFILMAANNLMDAWVSVRYANTPRPTVLFLPGLDGGLQASLSWRF